MNAAEEWIRTDRTAILEDIKRLGIDVATDFQMDIVLGHRDVGDFRWKDITREQMFQALKDLQAQ